MKFFSVILFVFLFELLSAQTEEYTKYYYPNGTLSAEGILRNGKPDGFWKSYYENGTLKSEGNRYLFDLDSVWNFYLPDGNLETSITYRNGKRNGFTFNYKFYTAEDSSKNYYLDSKELYINGIREGNSYYYTKDGYLQFIYPYKRDKRNGEGREFDKDSVVITLINYHNGYLIEKIKINRKDDNGLKQGRWIDFSPSGTKIVETQYLDDKKNGVQRTFDQSGHVVSEQRFINGNKFVVSEVVDTEMSNLAEYKKTYYESGTIKSEGAFVDDMPVGIHKSYDESGRLNLIREYTSESILLGEGMYDNLGKRTGKWRLYDSYWDYFYAEGEYEKGKKEGDWIFYYANGNVEMQGAYEDDVPDKEWIWLYPNGNNKRVETYYSGLLEGPYSEFDSVGNIIVKGQYFDNKKTGEWQQSVGDITEYGSYDVDEKVGVWKQYFSGTKKMRYLGEYRNGEAYGVHRWMYRNGNTELIGEYRGGQKHKNWRKYNPDGTLYMTYTYKLGNLTKIDGVTLKKAGQKK